MRKIGNVLREKISRLSIATKLSGIITLLTALILIMFLSIIRYYNDHSFYQKLKEVSMTYLEGNDKMLDNLVANLDSYSRICFSNGVVQAALEKEAAGQPDFNLQGEVNQYLGELLVNIKQIDSIYVYSNEKLIASADQLGNHYPKYRRLEEFDWYGEAEHEEYCVDFSNDDFFRGSETETEICFRRIIRSMQSFQPIGYLIMTVSKEELSNLMIPDDADSYGSVFCLFNDKNSLIVISDPTYQVEMQSIGSDMIRAGEKMRICSIDGKKYMCCVLQSEKGFYMDAISIHDALQSDRNRNLIEVLLVILQSVITLAAIVLVSGLYTRPIHKLMESMKELQNGIFRSVRLESEHYEIRELISVYNHMVLEINRLIERIREVEQLKGRADLKALTAQINPHFLYNTFDSIKSLFMLQRYEDAYAMIDALSRFYRINLSKGDEFITIEQNLVMLKSYVDIQQMRFVGEFEYIYKVDPEILQWKILKFTLQPLLENAINHGIHGYTKQGVICLEILRTGRNSIRICLSDNGRGMSEETMTKALSGEEGVHGKSFGLFATLHRLQYCYGDRMVWVMESKEKQGTRITIDLILEEN